LCIKLSQATYSSAKQLYDECTYGELLEWAEDVHTAQTGAKAQSGKEEAVNVESQIINSY
jgi:hypothetical protein